MGMSKEARVLLYTKMYTAVSKATAETKNAKGESVKTTYNGKISDLFDGICNNAPTIRAFMWAITHKTDALPTVLFRVVDHGMNGSEVSRIHSGFYDDQRTHIVGSALIPFIMEAMKLWEPKKRSPKVTEPVIVLEAPKQEDSPKICYDCTGKLNLQEMSDDELTNLQFQISQEFDRRAAIREKQVKLAQVLELAEMSKEELMDLLGTV